MRKWYVPLTVLGLGSLGVLLFSERGRDRLRWFFNRLEEAPDRLSEWNDTAQAELERIQETLNRISEAMEPHPELGQ